MLSIIKVQPDIRIGNSRIRAIVNDDVSKILAKYPCKKSSIMTASLKDIHELDVSVLRAKFLIITLDYKTSQLIGFHLSESTREQPHALLMKIIDDRNKNGLSTLVYGNVGNFEATDILIRHTTRNFQSAYILVEDVRGDYHIARSKMHCIGDVVQIEDIVTFPTN